jgi:hypothetical protein
VTGASSMLSSTLVKGAKLRVYQDYPHGMCSTHTDQINPDLRAFIKVQRTVSRQGVHPTLGMVGGDAGV